MGEHYAVARKDWLIPLEKVVRTYWEESDAGMHMKVCGVACHDSWGLHSMTHGGHTK